MSELIPCRHLDYNEEKHPNCELKTCEPHFPNVKYFEREVLFEGAPTKVQFCGKGKGRINSVFECYEGCMSCYEPKLDKGSE